MAAFEDSTFNRRHIVVYFPLFHQKVRSALKSNFLHSRRVYGGFFASLVINCWITISLSVKSLYKRKWQVVNAKHQHFKTTFRSFHAASHSNLCFWSSFPIGCSLASFGGQERALFLRSASSGTVSETWRVSRSTVDIWHDPTPNFFRGVAMDYAEDLWDENWENMTIFFPNVYERHARRSWAPLHKIYHWW